MIDGHKTKTPSSVSSIADPDVWVRHAMKPDGEEYYEYRKIICYVLVIE